MQLQSTFTMKSLRMALAYSTGLMSAVSFADEPLSPEQICSRLQISEEILVFDTTGSRITNVDRIDRDYGRAIPSGERSKKNPDSPVCTSRSISGHSSDSFTGRVFFSHEWNVMPNGTINLVFEQAEGFEGRGRDSKPVKSQGRKVISVKDFTPFVWVSPLHSKERVVVRLTPTLNSKSEPRDVSKLPIIIRDATIYDGKGRLWSANLNAEGQFIAASSLQGSIAMSFQEFQGAKKIGIVRGRDIRFSTPDNTSVVIKSAEPVLPGDLTANVWMIVDPKRKAESIGSQSVSSSSDAQSMLENFNKGKN